MPGEVKTDPNPAANPDVKPAEDNNQLKELDENDLVPEHSYDDSGSDCIPNSQACTECCLHCNWLSYCAFGWAVIVDENVSKVAKYYGKLFRELRTPGIYCLNPNGLDLIPVSRKKESSELVDIKVMDKDGKPIIVSAVIRYKIIDCAKAALKVNDFNLFIVTQGTAVLKDVCGNYPYTSSDGSPSLQNESATVQKELVKSFQDIAFKAGGLILSFDLTNFQYSPEIANMMLVKQAALARIDAKNIIVEGATEIITKSVGQLAKSGLPFSEDDQRIAVRKLCTVLCGDKN